MFCKNCGHQIPDGAIICVACGAPTDNYRQIEEKPSQKGQNILAIIGFILSFFVSLAGLICSAIALKRADRDFGGDGKGFAIAGTVISSIALVAEIIGSIIFVVYIARFIIAGIIAGMPAEPIALLPVISLP